MIWIQPSFAPQTYEGLRQCRRLCENMYDPVISNSSISSPYTFTGIDPGSKCIVALNRIYGNEQPASLGSNIIDTLSSGKLYYILFVLV